MDDQRALMHAVRKVFPTAVLACCETLYREGVNERIFELVTQGATNAPLSEFARVCQHFLDQHPALPLNRLLLLRRPMPESESATDVANLLRQSSYSSIIGNVGAAKNGGRVVLLALNVCDNELQDRAQIDFIEKTFKLVTAAAFEKTTWNRQHGKLREKIEPELTPREQDVLVWLRQGKSNWVISQLVGISEHTVKHIVSVILQKYSATSRYELLDHSRADGVPVQVARAAKRPRSQPDLKRDMP